MARGGAPISPEDIGRAAVALRARRRRRPARRLLTTRSWSRAARARSRPRGWRRSATSTRSATHDIVFGIGPAGTGKTYLAMALAVRALMEKQVKRIVLTRPAVEAGERLGFLPGSMEEKVSPYLRPLYDALHDMMDFEKADQLVARGLIEVAPIAFMRGRTLNDAFVILDEAQNTTSEQMKMFLTRLGFESKAVITGDVTQIDLPDNRRSGLNEAIDAAVGHPGDRVPLLHRGGRGAPPAGAGDHQGLRRGQARRPGSRGQGGLPARARRGSLGSVRAREICGRDAGGGSAVGRPARYELAELVETARALASERDIKKLLAVILQKCRQVTGADAGSVYVRRGGGRQPGRVQAGAEEVPPLHAVAERFDEDRLQGVQRWTSTTSRSSARRCCRSTPINIPDLTQAGVDAQDEDAAPQPQLRREDRLPRALDADGADAVGGRRGHRRRPADQQAARPGPPARRRRRRRRRRSRSTSAPRSWRWRGSRWPASRWRTRCSTTRFA